MFRDKNPEFSEFSRSSSSARLEIINNEKQLSEYSSTKASSLPVIENALLTQKYKIHFATKIFMVLINFN